MSSDHLFSALRESGRWAAEIDQLEPMPLHERPERVSQWCMRAARSGDGQEAVRLYAFLVLALQDANGGQPATVLAVQTAMRLYLWLRDEEESGSTMKPRPALLVFKKRLLTAVADGWSEVQESDALDQMKRFLAEAGRTRDPEVREALADVLAVAVGRAKKTQRALPLMVELLVGAPLEDSENLPARALLTGVWDALPTARARLVLSMILMPLPLDSLDWLGEGLNSEQFLADLGEEIAVRCSMFDAVRDLKRHLATARFEGCKSFRLSAFAPAYSASPPIVTLKLGVTEELAPSTEQQAQTNFDKIASSLYDHVEAWRRARMREVPTGSAAACPKIKLLVSTKARLHGKAAKDAATLVREFASG